MSDPIAIRRIDALSPALREGLLDLLSDCVNGGASVGFLAPLGRATALRFWDRVAASLGTNRALWVAESDGVAVGSVQLELCERDNALHRAEVQKLLVRHEFRRRGIAAMLMDALEAFARAQGRTLLTLDTEAGSAAEKFYHGEAWRRAGEIPDYALDPAGTMRGTAYYYKPLPRG